LDYRRILKMEKKVIEKFGKKAYLLGIVNGEKEYLIEPSWDCGWYWGGGYLSSRSMHTHFNSCFLDIPDIRGHSLGNFVTPWDRKKDAVVISNGCSVWEDITTFLDDVPGYLTGKNWWRIKDLYKQFYRLRDAAEVFQYGGHCTSDGRTEAEINHEMAARINGHIELVIIPEIIRCITPPAHGQGEK
jgi:hypothetical protein